MLVQNVVRLAHYPIPEIIAAFCITGELVVFPFLSTSVLHGHTHILTLAQRERVQINIPGPRIGQQWLHVVSQPIEHTQKLDSLAPGGRHSVHRLAFEESQVHSPQQNNL